MDCSKTEKNLKIERPHKLPSTSGVIFSATLEGCPPPGHPSVLILPSTHRTNHPDTTCGTEGHSRQRETFYISKSSCTQHFKEGEKLFVPQFQTDGCHHCGLSVQNQLEIASLW